MFSRRKVARYRFSTCSRAATMSAKSAYSWLWVEIRMLRSSARARWYKAGAVSELLDIAISRSKWRKSVRRPCKVRCAGSEARLHADAGEQREHAEAAARRRGAVVVEE